jgi:hypothetical protein
VCIDVLYGDVLKRRRFVEETFCLGDVLSRRRFECSPDKGRWGAFVICFS